MKLRKRLREAFERKIEMVTLKDIAKACDVSQATVSKALNGQSDIGTYTAELIKEKARELGYLPNAAARALKTKKSHNIGVLFEDQTSSGLQHEYFSRILDSVRVTAEEKGYDITFISNNLGSKKLTYTEHTLYRNCDGVIIATVDFKDNAVQELVKSSIPTVTLDYLFDGNTAILSDNVGGMKAIVRYIYEQGHRKVAIIHGEDTAVTAKRLASFYNMCNELHIEVKDSYVKKSRYHDPEGTAKATRELLENEERPTCIIFPDDFSFLGGMNEIEKKGLSIPKDISVVGYDGILFSSVLRPQLTTYKQNAKELGRLATEKIIEQIENPKSFIPQQYIVTGELLQGGTVSKI